VLISFSPRFYISKVWLAVTSCQIIYLPLFLDFSLQILIIDSPVKSSSFAHSKFTHILQAWLPQRGRFSSVQNDGFEKRESDTILFIQ